MQNCDRERVMRLDRDGMGPSKRLHLRLRLWSWVREVRWRMELVRLRSSKMRQETWWWLWSLSEVYDCFKFIFKKREPRIMSFVCQNYIKNKSF